MAIMTKSFRQRLAEIFGLDLRSLALFRIPLALVVLVDLSVRFSQVTAHYSGLGVLPLGSLSKVSASPFYWSIFALSDSVLVQSILFIVAIAIALLLLIGYHTRLATIATWALIVSLHHRNPLLLFAADDVIRAVLFWAMFLPWCLLFRGKCLKHQSQPLTQACGFGCHGRFYDTGVLHLYVVSGL